MARSLQVIANEILADWNAQGKQFSTALPYLLAMRRLHSFQDSYGCDEATDIVLRFLCNASSWRGEAARRIKNELNRAVKEASAPPAA